VLRGAAHEHQVDAAGLFSKKLLALRQHGTTIGYTLSGRRVCLCTDLAEFRHWSQQYFHHYISVEHAEPADATLFSCVDSALAKVAARLFANTDDLLQTGSSTFFSRTPAPHYCLQTSGGRS
jgi:hypothetical protein